MNALFALSAGGPRCSAGASAPLTAHVPLMIPASRKPAQGPVQESSRLPLLLPRGGARQRWALWAAVVVTLGSFAGARAALDRPGAAPAVALPAAPVAVGLGVLLPESGVRSVSVPAGAGDARVAELHVAEGDQVEAGQLLAELDTAPRLRAALARAEALVDLRRAEHARTLAQLRGDRAEAEAALRVARSDLDLATTERARVDRLFAGAAVPQADLDAAGARAAARAAERDRASARLSRLGRAPQASPEAIAAAQAVTLAERDLDLAALDLEAAHVRAPVDGVILSVLSRPGERPTADGLLRLADTSRMIARIEVAQARARALRPGDPVTLSADCLPAPLTGAVVRIGREVERQGEIGADPAANTNARVITVTVALDPAASALAANFTNLQVTARFEAHP